MKMISWSILVLATLASCGKSDTSSSSVLGGRNGDAEPIKAVFSEDVRLVDVVVEFAPGPALGMWTKALVRVGYDCSDALDAVTHSVEERDGQYTVHVAAIVRKNVAPGRACYIRPSQDIDVLLRSGIVAKEKVRVQPLLGYSMELGQTFPGKFVDGSRVKVKSVESLCPYGVTCMVDGTIVTIQVEKSCLEYVGPVGFSYNQVDHQIKLAVGSFLDVIAPVALCTDEVRVEEFSIQLVNFYVDSADDIDFSVLGSR